MKNKGYVRIEEVLDGIYQDAGYQSIQWNEALSWTGRVLSLLGVNALYITKVTNGVMGNLPPIKVENYRGKVPANFIQVVQCREYNHKIPMYVSSGTFLDTYENVVGDCNTTESVCEQATLTEFEEDPITRKQFFDCKDMWLNSVDWYNSFKSYSNIAQIEYQLNYRMDVDYIFTNFKEGLIEMAYKTFPMDEEGRPLIPRDDKIIRAVETFVMERMAHKRYHKDPTQTTRAFWKDMQQEKMFAISSARSNANVPDVDEMESIANQWNRLLPDTRAYEAGFKHNNIDERRHH